jgi:protein-disulfide isomerase
MDINNDQNLSRKERIELRREERKLGSQKSGGKTGRRILIWLAVILIVGGGIYGVVKLAGSSSVSNNNGLLYAAVGASDWVKGNKEAKTVLVEYSDYQCPACALFSSVVKEIVAQNPDKLSFVYRNFPLSEIHRNALVASYAAEAAGKQGKFWEMHDMIFENQAVWSEEIDPRGTFVVYAGELNLNTDKFTIDMNSKDIKDKVDNDYQSGVKSGVNATPTFYLNGKQMSSPTSFDDFKNTIQQAINAQ